MNAKNAGRPAERPTHSACPTIVADSEHLRAAISAALESLGSGAVGEATAILLSILEDGPTTRRYSCECGWSGCWPGELERHQHLHHREVNAA